MTNFKLFSARMLLFMLIMGAQLVMSHSWLDSVKDESTGELGYIRGYIGREGDTDKRYSYLIRNGASVVCKPDTQQTPMNFPGYPRLKAAPGDRVVAYHTENGHVSKPMRDDSKSGLTYWFGTTNQQTNFIMDDVLKVRDDGIGSDGQVQYLGASPYDDGKCSEGNSGSFSAARGVKPGENRPCMDAGFVIPNGLRPGSVFTVIWLWDFSMNTGKPLWEWYSSCLDIDIVSASDKPTFAASSTPTAGYNAPVHASETYGPAQAF